MDRLASTCQVIFHLAAAVGVELIVKDPCARWRQTSRAPRWCCGWRAAIGKKVLLASTSEVYGKSVALPFREDADRVMGPTAKSRWSYAESKAIDEFLGLGYHKQFGLPVVICRFFNTVGARQTGSYGMVIPRLVQQALANQPLTVYGDGQQTRCFCNVKDTVRAVAQLAAEPAADGRNLQCRQPGRNHDQRAGERGLSRAPPAGRRGAVPFDMAYEKGFEDMQRRVPSIAKIGAAIGWAPAIGLDQTLDEVIAYFRPPA